MITTDGMENASREFTVSWIKDMIEEKKKENDWEFIFLGANMDAVKEASKFGIGADRSASYINDIEGLGKTYARIACAMSAMRAVPRSALEIYNDYCIRLDSGTDTELKDYLEKQTYLILSGEETFKEKYGENAGLVLDHNCNIWVCDCIPLLDGD